MHMRTTLNIDDDLLREAQALSGIRERTAPAIDHFRRWNAALAERLTRGEVRSHPFVTGELSCGNLRRRKEILSLLAALPQAMLAGHEEALAFVEANRLMRRGGGWGGPPHHR